MYDNKVFAPEALSLDAVEGFLFGLAMTPQLVPPNEWIPVAFGESEPEFRSEKETKTFFEIIFTQYNSLLHDFDEGKMCFPFNVENLDCLPLEQLKSWARGFCVALGGAPDIWKSDEEIDPAGEDFPLQQSQTLFLLVGNMDTLKNHPDAVAAYDDLDAILASLPTAMEVLLNHAEQYEEEMDTSAAPVATAKKAGRNDPCPCGSGKKYKKCCLNNPVPAAPENIVSLSEHRTQVPELSSSDRNTLSRIVQAQIKAAKKGRSAELKETELEFLVMEPAALFGLIKMFTTVVADEDDADEATVDTLLSLISLLLEELRFSLEREKQGASERLKNLQYYLAQIISKEPHGLEVASMVCRCMADARLPIDSSLKELYNTEGMRISQERDQFADGVDDTTILGMFEEHGIDDPYEGFHHLMDAMQMFDTELTLSFVGRMTESEIDLLREIAALFVMHPQQQVREQVVELLQHFVTAFSPQTLSRLILLRNWLPEKERNGLDQCIKKARKARIDCAAVKACQGMECYVSAVDGNGAQMIWFKSGDAENSRLDCLLWKQAGGFVDAWCAGCTKAEIATILRKSKKEISMAKVEPGYVDRMVCHALSIGAELGGVPPLGVLESAEKLGISHWKPAPVSIDAVVDALNDEAREQKKSIFTAKAQYKILDESFDWVGSKKFADSWFEDHVGIDRMLQKHLNSCKTWGQQQDKGVELIVEEFLEQKRDVWAERLVLTTLWLKAHTGRAPLGWHKMLCLANFTLSDAPLADNPLMVAVAFRTLQAAYDRGE